MNWATIGLIIALCASCIATDGGAPAVFAVDIDGDASVRYDLNTVWASGDGQVYAKVTDKTIGFPFYSFETDEGTQRLRRRDPGYDETTPIGTPLPSWALPLFISDAPQQDPVTGTWTATMATGSKVYILPEAEQDVE